MNRLHTALSLTLGVVITSRKAQDRKHNCYYRRIFHRLSLTEFDSDQPTLGLNQTIATPISEDSSQRPNVAKLLSLDRRGVRAAATLARWRLVNTPRPPVDPRAEDGYTTADAGCRRHN